MIFEYMMLLLQHLNRRLVRLQLASASEALGAYGRMGQESRAGLRLLLATITGLGDPGYECFLITFTLGCLLLG